MQLRPKAFCPSCYDKVQYKVASSETTISVHEVSFSYQELIARCVYCGAAVYVPAINDRNEYERHKAYYEELKQIGECNEAAS